MRIAVFNALSTAAISAEREFAQRCEIALRNLGHDARAVRTSQEVIALKPDFVLVTSENLPKLTDHFTAGVLCGPHSIYVRDEGRRRNVGSWDLIIPGNPNAALFARDLHFSLRRNPDVSACFLELSSPVLDLDLPDVGNLRLACIGTSWDGERHKALFRQLSNLVELSTFGPEEAWSFLPQCYQGSIPVDGTSVIKALNTFGAVLAPHRWRQREEAIASARVFEACAAKCLVITENLRPLHQCFGDALEYVDLHVDVRQAARKIATLLEECRSNVSATAERMKNAHAIFSRHKSLDALLPPLLKEIEQKIAGRKRIPPDVSTETVSIIIRCGGRPLSMISRAVNSLRNQSYRNIAIIFVCFDDVDGLAEYVEELRRGDIFRRIQMVRVTAGGSRSAPLWAGLRMIDTPFFANLDDDDELFSDHVQRIMDVFEREPELDLVYSGGIRNEEESQQDNAPLSKEPRELLTFDRFDLHRMLKWDNMILSHSFVARSRMLTSAILEAEPELEVLEDVYLYLILIAGGAQIGFSGRVSAQWNWRSLSADNSMIKVAQQQRHRSMERIALRLAGYEFPQRLLGQARLEAPATQISPHDAYEATLLEGVDFRRPNLPSFIETISGISEPEPWGRWSVGEVVEFHFQEELPPEFTIWLHAFPSLHNLDHLFVVRVGDFAAQLKMSSVDPATYEIRIINRSASDTIAIVVPNPTAPASVGQSSDVRRLGLAMISLRIEERRAIKGKRARRKPFFKSQARGTKS